MTTPNIYNCITPRLYKSIAYTLKVINDPQTDEDFAKALRKFIDKYLDRQDAKLDMPAVTKYITQIESIFDTAAPLDQWQKMTAADIRRALGIPRNSPSGNDKVSRDLKNVFSFWPRPEGLPPDIPAQYTRGCVYYWMPPLKS